VLNHCHVIGLRSRYSSITYRVIIVIIFSSAAEQQQQQQADVGKIL